MGGGKAYARWILGNSSDLFPSSVSGLTRITGCFPWHAHISVKVCETTRYDDRATQQTEAKQVLALALLLTSHVTKKMSFKLQCFKHKNGISTTTELDNPFPNRIYGKALKKLYKDMRWTWVYESPLYDYLAFIWLITLLLHFWIYFLCSDYCMVFLTSAIFLILIRWNYTLYCFWSSLNYFLPQLPNFSLAPDFLCLSVLPSGKCHILSLLLPNCLFFSFFTAVKF